MTRRIVSHLLPDLFSPEELKQGTAVVIDILRASSTMTTALANGLEKVIPCETIEQAEAVKKTLADPHLALLGGERKGSIIPGFDLGNSPGSYSAETVRGKTLVFTTTNGTRALHRCREADEVLVGCFLNLQSLADRLVAQTGDVHLVCAGTDRRVTQEDCLFAGALAETLLASEQVRDWEIDDSTRLCLALAEKWPCSEGKLLQGLQNSQGGRNLARLRLENDVLACSQLNSLQLVPVWDKQENQIRAV